MKKFFLLSLLLAAFAGKITAQDAVQVLPEINVKDLQGQTVSTSKFENDGKPIIISFWATWCKPCILELNTIQEEYADWVEETGVKLIAISIDDARNAPKVAPFVMGRDWEYEVYIDENSDLKRALSVNNVPHTFLLNGNKEIVWNHNSYSPGDEEELLELVKKLAATGKIDAGE
ncbi:MAG TPA: TlpA disulfide reductase family protein [Bacteroidia bacterium]|nr:TlpA disulfide reductase family protein [Bacteroidia bacterium]